MMQFQHINPSMKSQIHNVLIVCGSLRKASTNAGLLRAIVAEKHPNFHFEWADISEFPVFNEDIEAKGVPAAVTKVRQQIVKSDAILFGIPEYNYSMSSPFKNAYDWLSRQYPTEPSPVAKKTAAIVSVGGASGGSKAQKHFLESSDFCKVNIMPPEENPIRVFRWTGKGGERFDKEGNLECEETRKTLRPWLDKFSKWIETNAKSQ